MTSPLSTPSQAPDAMPPAASAPAAAGINLRSQLGTYIGLALVLCGMVALFSSCLLYTSPSPRD